MVETAKKQSCILMITCQTSLQVMLQAELMLHSSGHEKTKGHLIRNKDEIETGGSILIVLAEWTEDEKKTILSDLVVH